MLSVTAPPSPSPPTVRPGGAGARAIPTGLVGYNAHVHRCTGAQCHSAHVHRCTMHTRTCVNAHVPLKVTGIHITLHAGTSGHLGGVGEMSEGKIGLLVNVYAGRCTARGRCGDGGTVTGASQGADRRPSRPPIGRPATCPVVELSVTGRRQAESPGPPPLPFIFQFSIFQSHNPPVHTPKFIFSEISPKPRNWGILTAIWAPGTGKVVAVVVAVVQAVAVGVFWANWAGRASTRCRRPSLPSR